MKMSKEHLDTLREYYKHPCCGYPDCDGDLPGEDHSGSCPAYGHPSFPVTSIKSMLNHIDELEHELSALREMQKAREAALIEMAAIVAGNTITEEGRSEALATIVMRSVRELRPDSALDDLLREARREALEKAATIAGEILLCKEGFDFDVPEAIRAALEPEGKP